MASSKLRRVYAPVKRQYTGDYKRRQVVVFEKHPLHPGGEVFIAEGDGLAEDGKEVGIEVFIGAPMVKKMLGNNRLKLIEKGGDPVPSAKDPVDPDDISSLGVTEKVVAALEERSIFTVPELVDAVKRGMDLTDVDGIGEGTKDKIVTELEKRDLLPVRGGV